jgi:hypothetical protein
MGRKAILLANIVPYSLKQRNQVSDHIETRAAAASALHKFRGSDPIELRLSNEKSSGEKSAGLG